MTKTFLHVEIHEIENGFTVDLFGDYPYPTELDRIIFVSSIDEALVEIYEWMQKEKKALKEQK